MKNDLTQIERIYEELVFMEQIWQAIIADVPELKRFITGILL
jgi:hypothetical protein